MSPNATISTIHRAEVRIPAAVFARFGKTQEYEMVALSAARAVETSGQCAYSDVIEWGQAPTRRQCEDFVAHWHNWILQWQQQTRTACSS